MASLEPDTRLKFYEIIIDYGIAGIEPKNLKGLDSVIWELIKFNMDGGYDD